MEEIIEKLSTLGKEMGLSGSKLRAWVEEQQTNHARSLIDIEERKKDEHGRTMAEKNQSYEHLEREKQIQMIRLKEEETKAENLKVELEVLKMKKDLQSTEEGHGHTPAPSARTNEKKVKIPRLPNFEESRDSISNYLDRFERYVKVVGFAPENYATVLSSFLSGSALEVYTRLSDQEAEDYDILKANLLSRYQVTAEQCRLKFRENILLKDETFTQARARLEMQLSKWVKMSGKSMTNAEDMTELILMEQLQGLCSREMRIHLKEKDPKTSLQLAEIADRYREARRGVASGLSPRERPTPLSPNHAREGGAKSDRGARPKLVCAFCNKPGHTVDRCFKKHGRPGNSQK